MATLTLDPKRIPKSERGRTDRYIRECWRKMRVLLSRKFGESLPFVAVLEFQENGRAHLHVLLGVYVPQAWLSQAWQSIGGGKIVDIRFVDVHRVSAISRRIWPGKRFSKRWNYFPNERASLPRRALSCFGAKGNPLVGSCDGSVSANCTNGHRIHQANDFKLSKT